MKIELLLNEIGNTIKKHKLIQQKTGGYFNIFEITNIANDEVRICRFLYDLLKPKGSHFQGDLYLKLFIEHVLQLKIPMNEIKEAIVHREYVIEGNRRIDLVIQTPNYLIPIEVKIFAGDQENQCVDYYKVAQNSNVYYLTRFGDMPTDFSSVEKKYITPISFSQDILKWLSKCLEQRETMKIAPIREVLMQFMSAIRNFTEQLEDEQEVEIKNILAASSTTMKSAFAIERSLKVAKIDLLHRVFKEIESRIHLEKLHNEYDYEFNNQKKINTYYDFKSSTYPGISYLYSENVKPGVDIWFRVELDEFLYAGFVVAVEGQAGNQVLSEKEIVKHLPHIKPYVNRWWAYYELIPFDDNAQVPNFKYPDENDVFFNLFDEDYFNTFINKSMERIEALLK